LGKELTSSKNLLLISDSSYIQNVIERIFEQSDDVDDVYFINKLSTEEFRIRNDRHINYDLIVLNISSIDNKRMESILNNLSNITYKKIILLTTLEESKYGQIFIEAGFDGYLEEHFPVDKLKEIILSLEINSNGSFFTDETKNKFIKKISFSKKVKKIKLTSKEKTIIRYLATGLASKQIAEDLKLSQTTVNVHRLNIKKKLGLKSGAALINFAHNHINFEIDHAFDE
jgi:DNA-binding NarL/FixJ family response regulator